MLSAPNAQGALIVMIYPDGNVYLKRGVQTLHITPDEAARLQAGLAEKLPINSEALKK